MIIRVAHGRDLEAPTVHLNGTSKGELARGLMEANDALTDALAAMADASPNARDYYVTGDPQSYQRAAREHTERLEKVAQVRAELRAIYEAVQEQRR